MIPASIHFLLLPMGGSPGLDQEQVVDGQVASSQPRQVVDCPTLLTPGAASTTCYGAVGPTPVSNRKKENKLENVREDAAAGEVIIYLGIRMQTIVRILQYGVLTLVIDWGQKLATSQLAPQDSFFSPNRLDPFDEIQRKYHSINEDNCHIKVALGLGSKDT